MAELMALCANIHGERSFFKPDASFKKILLCLAFS